MITFLAMSDCQNVLTESSSDSVETGRPVETGCPAETGRHVETGRPLVLTSHDKLSADGQKCVRPKVHCLANHRDGVSLTNVSNSRCTVLQVPEMGCH